MTDSIEARAAAKVDATVNAIVDLIVQFSATQARQLCEIAIEQATLFREEAEARIDERHGEDA